MLIPVSINQTLCILIFPVKVQMFCSCFFLGWEQFAQYNTLFILVSFGQIKFINQRHT